MTFTNRAFAWEHLGLAHSQSRHWQLGFDDLLGSANERLCKGAIGFDPSLGHRPSSHLVPKVNGEMLRHLRDTGYLLRISHRLRELWAKAWRPPGAGLERC